MLSGWERCSYRPSRVRRCHSILSSIKSWLTGALEAPDKERAAALENLLSFLARLADDKFEVFSKSLARITAAMSAIAVKVYSARGNTKRLLLEEVSAVIAEGPGAPSDEDLASFGCFACWALDFNPIYEEDAPDQLKAIAASIGNIRCWNFLRQLYWAPHAEYFQAPPTHSSAEPNSISLTKL